MKNICLAKKNAFTVFYVRFSSLPGVWSVFLQCKIFPASPSSCICGDGQMVNDSSAMWNQNSVAGKKNNKSVRNKQNTVLGIKKIWGFVPIMH